MSKNILPIIIVVSLVLILASGFGGYYYGKTQSKLMIVNHPQPAIADSNGLPFGFASQANFQGQVIQLSGDTATVVNKDNQSQTFKVAKSVNILNPTLTLKPGSSPSARARLTTIPLNQPALMTLELINNQYQITTVILSAK